MNEELLEVAKMALDFIEREGEQRRHAGVGTPDYYIREPMELAARLRAAIAKALATGIET